MTAPPPFLLDYARRSEPRLRNYLDAKLAQLANTPLDLAKPLGLLREYVVRGGKRVRGALVIEGMRAGGGDPAAALDASVGMELAHAYLLIHDDFMDRDDVRRGGPTIHAALRDKGEHLAGSLAILLGSLCQAWAWELVLQSPVEARNALAAAQLLSTALQEVTVGQALDLLAPTVEKLDAKKVLEIQRLKTGGYTFELPLRLGALLAGASKEVLEALERYARPLGQAFQIADDILGSFGEPEVTGKANASDLREGKQTLLVARALEMASPADAKKLREGLGKADADVDELREILRRSGALDAARAEAGKLRDEAVRAAAGLPVTLHELAGYVVGRSA